MQRLQHLLDNNRQRAAGITEKTPDFFHRLSMAQTPEYLWIGCADSRVPANEIVGLLPGEIFVHRNIANLALQTDFNCMSVIEYAVEVLRVKHIIVCGHYGCGGIHAAMENTSYGLIDNWLHSIRNLYYRNKKRMDALEGPEQRRNRLCELNVIQQVKNISHSHVVQRAWASGRPLVIHGWIYSLRDGLLKDLGMPVQSLSDLDEEYRVVPVQECQEDSDTLEE